MPVGDLASAVGVLGAAFWSFTMIGVPDVSVEGRGSKRPRSAVPRPLVETRGGAAQEAGPRGQDHPGCGMATGPQAQYAVAAIRGLRFGPDSAGIASGPTGR